MNLKSTVNFFNYWGKYASTWLRVCM